MESTQSRVVVKLTPEEEALCDALKSAVKLSNPRKTITAVAGEIGVSFDVLSNMVNRRTAPTDEVVNGVRKALALPAHWPSNEVNRALRTKGLVDLEGESLVEIEIVGTIAAGAEIYNVDAERKIAKVPAELALISDLAWIVDGDSGMPHLHDGDLSCFKHRTKPKHGLPFLIQTADNGLMVKVLWFDRGEWFLRSWNKKHRPVRMPDGASLCGILVGFYRVDGKRKQMLADPDGLTFDFDRGFSEDFT